MFKLRIFSIALASLILLISFQNCGKATTLLSSPTTPTDSSGSVAQASGDPEPDLIADQSPDGLGGIIPNNEENESPAKEPARPEPTCFNLEQVGPSDNDPTKSVFVARLFSPGGHRFAVRTAELWTGKNFNLKIGSTKIDNGDQSVAFVAVPGQIGFYTTVGWFAGPEFNVVLYQCVD